MALSSTRPIKTAAVLLSLWLRLFLLDKLAGKLEPGKKGTHAHDAAFSDTELSLCLNNLCLQVLSRIVYTSVRYSRISYPIADTASGISHSGSHCMAPFGHYSMTFLNCLSARFFLKYILSFRSPIVRSSLFIRINGIRHTVTSDFYSAKV